MSRFYSSIMTVLCWPFVKIAAIVMFLIRNICDVLACMFLLCLLFSWVAALVMFSSHNINGAVAYVIVPMSFAVLYLAADALRCFAIICARKTDHPTKKCKNGTPKHRSWPIWLFLGFFILEVLLIAVCYYFATHMWCVRDLLNFFLFAMLSIALISWITDSARTKK